MRPRLETLNHRLSNQSFVAYEVKVPSFDFYWHYHPEYELTYIVEGKGMRLVGDSYEPFGAGDLVLLGPMLPHTWVTEKTPNGSCQALVIQFSQAFIEQLVLFAEMKDLEKLFAKASRGLQFGIGDDQTLPLMLQVLHSGELLRLSYLLQVLHQLTHHPGTPIASLQYKPLKGDENQQRLNKVLRYIQSQFREQITLEQAAALVHLSKSAFCKFFKRASGKTFSDYTNDIRLAHACRLLVETDQSITQIATDAGFESLTYFNRIFLKKKKVRPGEFRRIGGR